MDLQTRKIEFVQEFLKLQNEELIIRLEKLLCAYKSDNLKPMTVAELNERIELSMEDSKKNRLTTTSDLIAEIDKWG